MRDHQLARPMDLYNKIHWAIFSLPRYFARVGPLYYIYSLGELKWACILLSIIINLNSWSMQEISCTYIYIEQYIYSSSTKHKNVKFSTFILIITEHSSFDLIYMYNLYYQSLFPQWALHHTKFLCKYIFLCFTIYNDNKDY